MGPDAEFSCDRAATLAVRDPKIICRTLMVLAGGVSADELDLDAFMAQAMEYDNWEDGHDRVRRFFAEIGKTHANAVRRVSEIMRWVQSGEYDRIQRGEYRKRSDPVDPREEAGDAFDFYSERFREMFSEMGDSITNIGSQVGNASSQVADGCAIATPVTAATASSGRASSRSELGADRGPERRRRGGSPSAGRLGQVDVEARRRVVDRDLADLGRDRRHRSG